jgi:D-amino-acid dehydrogenase
LAEVCARKGTKFIHDAEVCGIFSEGGSFGIRWRSASGMAEVSRTAIQDMRADAIVVCAGVESRRLAAMVGDRVNVYPVKGYSITVNLEAEKSQSAAPQVSLLDEAAKIVTSRLGSTRFRVAGTAEFNGFSKDIRADRIRPLAAWVRTNFPEIDTSKIVPWAGLRPMMPDMLPVVRRGRRQGVFYNTGHGHLGWTLSAATAQTVAALVEASRSADRAA